MGSAYLSAVEGGPVVTPEQVAAKVFLAEDENISLCIARTFLDLPRLIEIRHGIGDATKGLPHLALTVLRALCTPIVPSFNGQRTSFGVMR